MKMHLSFFVLLLVLLSCEDTYVTSGLCDLELVKSTQKYSNGPFDSTTTINDITWDGNCLEISVSYSGGCEEHEWELVTDGNIMESSPIMMNFAIIHDNSDSCEAYITESKSFELSADIIPESEDKIIMKFSNPEFSYMLEK